jgi:hypothetical protein
MTKSRTNNFFDMLLIFSILLVGLMSHLTSFAILKSGKVGWDPPLDTAGYFAIRNLPPGQTLEKASELIFYQQEFYGILMQQLGNLFQCNYSQECIDRNSLETYFAQGSINLLLSFGTGMILGLLLWRMLNSKLAGAVAFSTYSTIPIIVGMGALNFKDIPLTFGLTFVTVGTIGLSFRNFIFQRQRINIFFGFIFVIIGAIFSIGVRPGSWPLVIFVALGGFTIVQFVAPSSSIRQSLLRVILIISAFAIAIAFVGVTHPVAKIDIFGWLMSSFRVASKFPTGGVALTNGSNLPVGDLPWWYVPIWLFAQLPLAMVIIFILSIVLILLGGAKRKLSLEQKIILLSFSVQGFIFPAIAIAANVTLYNGIRHFLFIFPFIAVIIAVCVDTLHDKSVRTVAFNFVTTTLILFVLLLNFWASSRWFPYSYAFVNPIAAGDTNQENWELDGMGVTIQESLTIFDEHGIEQIEALGGDIPSNYSIYKRNLKYNSSLYGMYYIQQRNLPVEAPNNCRILFEIKRDSQTLARGYACKSP